MATISRNTKQKDAIRDVLTAAGRPLSPEEILTQAQLRVTGISIATVYRNISALQRDNWLQAVDIPGMPPRYELAGKEHHHHFHCTECGKVYELDGCTVDVKPRLPKGFRVTSHSFSLAGQCAECR